MKIAMPKPSPNRQNRMPIRSSLWPSIAPLKKVTCERSGSFSEASPPSPAGWAKAVAVPKVRSAAAAEILVAMRRVKNAAVARKVRIEVLRYKNGFKELQNVFRFCLPEACPSSRLRYKVRPQARPIEAGDSVSGIPNTLPPQDRNGVLELGRVGVCARILPLAACRLKDWRSKSPAPAT